MKFEISSMVFCCYFRQLTLPNGTWRQTHWFIHFNSFIQKAHSLRWIMSHEITILPLEVNLHQGSPIVDGRVSEFRSEDLLFLKSFITVPMYLYTVCMYIIIYIYLISTCFINWFSRFYHQQVSPPATTPCRDNTKPHPDSAEVIAVAGNIGR